MRRIKPSGQIADGSAKKPAILRFPCHGRMRHEKCARDLHPAILSRWNGDVANSRSSYGAETANRQHWAACGCVVVAEWRSRPIHYQMCRHGHYTRLRAGSVTSAPFRSGFRWRHTLQPASNAAALPIKSRQERPEVTALSRGRKTVLATAPAAMTVTTHPPPVAIPAAEQPRARVPVQFLQQSNSTGSGAPLIKRLTRVLSQHRLHFGLRASLAAFNAAPPLSRATSYTNYRVRETPTKTRHRAAHLSRRPEVRRLMLDIRDQGFSPAL